MYKVDLNSDLGESFGAYTIGMDEAVIAHISSANIACGYHAGDPLVMDKTIAAAKAAGVAVGAHPGHPDLIGFGRRNMACSPKEVKAFVKYQLGAIQAFCTAQGVKLQHCKPHGALYNQAAKDMDLAMAIAEAIAEAQAKMDMYTNNEVAKLQMANDYDGIIAMAEQLDDAAMAQKITMQAYYGKKDYAKMVEISEAALAAQTTDEGRSDVYYLLGVAYNEMEKFDNAIAAMKNVTAGTNVANAQAVIAALSAE